MAPVTQAVVSAAIALATLGQGRAHPRAHGRECDRFARIVLAEAERHDLRPMLLVALVAAESSWDPEKVNRETGAIGLGQLLVYERGTGVVSANGRRILSGGFGAYLDQLADPWVNLFLAARWLRWKMDECRRARVPEVCAVTRYFGAHVSGPARAVVRRADELEQGGGR